MDIKEYHAHPALGSSTIREILRSTAHFEYRLNHKSKPTDAMILGDAIHAFILEPDRFNEMYELQTEVYLRKYGEHQAGEPKLDEDGEPIMSLVDRQGLGRDIKGEQYKKFEAMSEAIKKSDLIKNMMINSTHIEYSIFDELDGLKIKCRPDCMNVNDGIIYDVKTVGSKSESSNPSDNFLREFIDLRYDVQASLYVRLCEMKFHRDFEFRFMCVDVKKDVVGIKEYKVSDELMELGQYRLKKCLDLINKYNKDHISKVYDVESEDLKADYRALEMLEQFKGE